MTSVVSSTPASPLTRVIRIWSEQTGLPANRRVMDRLLQLDGRAALFDADDDTLVSTASESFQVHGHLAFTDWVRMIQNLKRTQHLQSGGSRADAPRLVGSSEASQRNIDRVTDFVGETVRAGWVSGVDKATLEEAVRRIEDRAATGDYRVGSLARRRPKLLSAALEN